MAVLVEAQVGQGEQRHAGQDNPQVAELPAGDAVHHAYQRDVLHDGAGVQRVLLGQADVPVVVLLDDVVPAVEQRHGRHEHHHGPEQESADEPPLMLGEQEEGQAQDAVDLYKRAEHDEERRPEVLFALYQVVRQQDGGRHGNVELLHEERRQHLVGAEPEDEHLLVLRELRPPDGPVEEDGQRDAPQQHAQPLGHDGEGGEQQREQRPVVVAVAILGGVQHVDVPAPPCVPERASVNQVVVGAVHLRQPHHDGQQHPQAPQRPVVAEERLSQKFFNLLHTACKGTKSREKSQIYLNFSETE